MARSPTFVAEFENGDRVVVTRNGKLSMAPGARLARAPYESRIKKPAPAIIAAHYECDGKILERGDVEQLNAVA